MSNAICCMGRVFFPIFIISECIVPTVETENGVTPQDRAPGRKTLINVTLSVKDLKPRNTIHFFSSFLTLNFFFFPFVGILHFSARVVAFRSVCQESLASVHMVFCVPAKTLLVFFCNA